MRHAYNREANVVGAAALALADAMRAAEERGGGHGAAAPAALVALDGLLAGATIGRVARVCGLSHSGAVRLADRLVAGRLLERRRGGDGRAVALVLTPAGRRAAARIRAQREAAVESALAP